MKKRYVGLDLFRIMLAVIVFMFHSRLFAACNYGFLNFLADEGDSVMTGFFVLSGVSIEISMRNRKLTDLEVIKAFYAKRFIKTVPLYWVVTLVYHVIWGGVAFRELLYLVPVDLMLLRTTVFLLPNSQFIWFISNIWFCYLIFPFYHTIISQLKMKMQLFALGGMIIMDIYMTQIIPNVFLLASNTYYSLFYRTIEFLIGILMGNIIETYDCHHKNSNVLVWILLGIEVITLLMGMKYISNNTLHSLFLVVLFCIMIVTLSRCENRWLDSSGTVRYVASLTYVFYLGQIWTLCFFEREAYRFLSLTHPLLRLIIVWLTTIVFAILLHESIEKPCTRWLSFKLLGN